MTTHRFNRRDCLAAMTATLSLAATMRPAFARAPDLTFDQLYASFSPLGLEFSQRVLELTGNKARAIAAAKAAGLPVLLYTGGYRSHSVEEIAADATFDDWSDLPGLVRDALGG